MRQWRKFIFSMGKEFFVAVFLILFLQVLAYYPIRENFRNAPRDRYYIGATDYPLDMVGDLGIVTQGYLGSWRRLPVHTLTIEGVSSFLKLEYLLIGHLARITGIGPLLMFFLTRFFVSVILLLLVWHCISSAFPTASGKLGVFIIALFSSSVIGLGRGAELLATVPGDALVFYRMTTAMPHYLLGTLFGLASLVAFAQSYDTGKLRWIFAFALFGFLTSYMYAPTAFLAFAAVAFWAGGTILWMCITIKKIPYRAIVMFGLYALAILLPALYIRYVSQFWDLSSFAKTELIVPFGLTVSDYVRVVGVPWIVALILMPFILTSGTTFIRLLVPWVIVHPLAIFFFADSLKIFKGRFFLTPYAVVFAILAGWGAVQVGKILAKGHGKYFHVVPMAILVAITLITSATSYAWSYGYARVCFCNKPLFDYGYPKREVMEAMFWLRDHTNPSEGVLSGFYAGTLISSFAGNRVYYDWFYYIASPPNLVAATTDSVRFYSHMDSEDEARTFLRRYHIGYVFLSDDERALTQNLSYSFLTPVMVRGQTVIYKVNN